MLIDSFLFHNEFDILEGRLEYLDDTVDFFVLVEMDSTHSGNAKELNFPKQISRYRKFLHKMVYVPFSPDLSNLDFSVKPDKMDFKSVQWIVENSHRNYLTQGLRFLPANSFVMISDVDEIPLKSAIESAKQNLNINRVSIAFEQEMFYYNFKQRQEKNWIGSVISTNENVIKLSPQWFRDNRWQLPKITNGGYHLSYWNTPEKIKEKIENFAHQELNNEKNTNLDTIKQKIKNHQDLFDREDNPFVQVEEKDVDLEFLQIFKKYEKE
jgi:beta-1,4-mannosyl-glycoprotein beta-1,4-N-acetylglucosaminyltransferase